MDSFKEHKKNKAKDLLFSKVLRLVKQIVNSSGKFFPDKIDTTLSRKLEIKSYENIFAVLFIFQVYIKNDIFLGYSDEYENLGKYLVSKLSEWGKIRSTVMEFDDDFFAPEVIEGIVIDYKDYLLFCDSDKFGL